MTVKLEGMLLHIYVDQLSHMVGFTEVEMLIIALSKQKD